MELQASVFEILKEIIEKYTVISISGESGTGKTSFALYLIGNLLDYGRSCIWIQASELFPRKRLVAMFQGKKYRYLLDNIFITPKEKTFSSYEEQLDLLVKIASEDFFIPPDLKFIVIDNISHHLRYKFANMVDIRQKFALLDRFYEYILFPLILKCQRNHIALVLIHEVSFDITTQKNRPFFHKLYERIRGVNMKLVKSFGSKDRTSEFQIGNQVSSFQFLIKDNEFRFS